MVERKTMKALTILFWTCLAGLLCALTMTILTAVKEHRKKMEATPIDVPTPALPASGNPLSPEPR